MRSNSPLPPPGFDFEHFHQLRVGMTVDEVCERLGRKYDHKSESNRGESFVYWYGSDLSVKIHVNAADRVADGETILPSTEHVKDDSWGAWLRARSDDLRSMYQVRE
jgi:hypothetical protein